MGNFMSPERKTSLGREWHPTCLKCNECGRVLIPGQHAEHKGLPYCHHPCYRALFGPDIIGFGTTVSQPKGRPTSCSLDYYDHHQHQQQHQQQHRHQNTTTKVTTTKTSNFKSYVDLNHDHPQQNTSTTSADITSTTTTTVVGTSFSTTTITTTSTSTSASTTYTNSYDSASTLKLRGLEPVFEDGDLNSHIDNINISTLKRYEQDSFETDTLKPNVHNFRSSDNSGFMNASPNNGEEGGVIPYDAVVGESDSVSSIPQHLINKVEAFNRYHQSKVNSQMTVEQQNDGSVKVRGPLRIYWGLSRPIQLSHCDDKPAAPVSKWRHSLHVGNKMSEIPERKVMGSMSMRKSHSPTPKSRELDDLLLPSASPDDVVRRKKKGVPKFKTVAYRGDEPTKWKRASINGHIFNYDTSVFTPVLGSCTCVNVDDVMDSTQVITTLLEKFKVQNSADEYVLSLVNEEGERLLTNSDRPLFERLNIGPQETLGKLFIKERQMEAEVLPVDAHIQMPIVEADEEENLPQEVEQLLVLPEAVLRGILVKYKKDEEQDVQLVKARYEAAKKRILNRLGEISFKTTSTV